MSSLPKRSDSNCSYTKGNDEISVRKIQEVSDDVEGRMSGVESIRSQTMLSSSGGKDDASIQDSCVLRHFSKYKSSHLRFLAWVAYTRKYANDSMTVEESRTCPLLWCRMQFSDQEEMLKHVWSCPHLSKGLYWCYHCQKHERLGKFHKRCQGTPSKTEKITTVAKRIFSKLGKAHHRKAADANDSGNVNASQGWKSDSKSMENGHPDTDPQSWGYPSVQELPDTSVCHEMAADWSAACQELPDSSIMEMMGTECMAEIGEGMESFPDNFYAETFEEYDIAPRHRGISPKLPKLDTSVGSLGAAIQWPDHQYSPSWALSQTHSSIVSPLSAVGTHDPNYILELSPTNSSASGQSFFTNSGCTSATSQSMYHTLKGPFSRIPSINAPKGTKRSWDYAMLVEESHHQLSVLPDLGAPMLFPVTVPDFDFGQAFASLESTPNVSRSSSNASGKSRAREPSSHWSDAATLVEGFSQVLDEHITHTKEILRQLPTHSVTSELLNMSKATILALGLKTVATAIDGQPPTQTDQIFAFTHIACASAIVMNHDREHVHSEEWFQDILYWSSLLPQDSRSEKYIQLASSIWSPNTQLIQVSHMPQSLRPNVKANQLLLSCQLFLDILSYLHLQDNATLSMQQLNHPKDFDFAQLSFEIKAKDRVLDRLITINTIEAFIADVIYVEKRLLQGTIKNVRELELELAFAGKLTSQSDAAYARFLYHVRTLCDEMYAENPEGQKSRSFHHLNDIEIWKLYFPLHSQVQESPLPKVNIHNFNDHSNIENDDMQFGFDFDAATAGDQVELTGEFHLNSEDFNTDPFVNSQFQTQMPSISTSLPAPPPLSVSPASNHTGYLQSPANKPNSSQLNLTVPQSTATKQKYTCPLCSYRPSGEERWKASNLRRHKRTQHPTLSADGGSGKKVYRCRFEGCKSVFTRSDNLRSHVRDKGHECFVGMGITEAELGDGEGRAEDMNFNTGLSVDGEERVARRRRIEDYGEEGG